MSKITKFLAASVLVVLAFPIAASASSEYRPQVATGITDIYQIKLAMRIPAIIDNMQSLGRRQYKTQRLVGEMRIHYGGTAGEQVTVTIPQLNNLNYKIRGVPVSYETIVSPSPIWTAVGDNKKDEFKKATLCMDIDANPSYNIGDDEPDNTLILRISCVGNQFGSLSGYASGQLGCGCHAYGHKSPTRAIGPSGATERVADIAATLGSVKITWKGCELDCSR